MVINGIIRIIFFSAKSVSCSVVSDSMQPQGLYPTRLLCPWDFPGKNNGVGCHSLLQGIFLTQGLNPACLHCRQIHYCLSHQGPQLYLKHQFSYPCQMPTEIMPFFKSLFFLLFIYIFGHTLQDLSVPNTSGFH